MRSDILSSFEYGGEAVVNERYLLFWFRSSLIHLTGPTIEIFVRKTM